MDTITNRQLTINSIINRQPAATDAKGDILFCKDAGAVLKDLGFTSLDNRAPLRTFVQKYADIDAKKTSCFSAAAAEKINGCNDRIETLRSECDLLIQDWFSKSEKIAPYRKQAEAQAHAEHSSKPGEHTCKDCRKKETEARVKEIIQEITPKEISDAALCAFDKAKAKDNEIKSAELTEWEWELLFKQAKALSRVEKDIAQVKRECEKLQNKIDGYRGEATEAEAKLPELETLLSSCRYCLEINVLKMGLSRKLERAQIDAEKIARHTGAEPDSSEATRITKQMESLDAERARMEQLLKGARTSFASRSISDIQMALQAEFNFAAELASDYKPLQSVDMKKLDKMGARSLALDKEFNSQLSKLAGEARQLDRTFSF